MELPHALHRATPAELKARLKAEREGRPFVYYRDGDGVQRIGNALVMPGCGPKLRAELEGRGYKVVTVPLGSFQRSGGAAFCLTLRLDRQSAAAAQPAPAKVSAATR